MHEKNLKPNWVRSWLQNIVSNKDNFRDVVLNILMATPEILEYVDQSGANVMMLAAREKESAQFISIFHELNPLLIEAVDNEGNTPLMYATGNGILESLMELLKLKPSLLDKTNNDGYNVLMLAMENKHTHIVDYLMQYNQGLINSNNIVKLLYIIAKVDNDKVANIILDQKPLNTNSFLLKIVDKEGNNILMAAAQAGAFNVFKQLFYHTEYCDKKLRKKSFNKVNNDGNNLSMIALSQKDHRFHNVILEHYKYNYSLDWKAINKDSDNLLTISMKSGCFKRVFEILKGRIEYYARNYRSPASYPGNYVCREQGYLRKCEDLREVVREALIIAIRKNLGFNEELFKTGRFDTNDTKRLIIELVQNGITENLSRLLDDIHTSDIQTYDRHEYLDLLKQLMDIAISSKKNNMVRFLYNENPHFYTQNSDMLFISAAQYGNIEVIRMLVEKGVDVNNINSSGVNAFGCTPNLDVGLMLIAAGVKEVKCYPGHLQGWLNVFGLRDASEYQVLKQSIENTILILDESVCLGTWFSKLPTELKSHIAYSSSLDNYPTVQDRVIKFEECNNLLKFRLKKEQATNPKLPGYEEEQEIISYHISQASNFISSLVVKKYIDEKQINLLPIQQSILKIQISNWTNKVLQAKQQLFEGYVFLELRVGLMCSIFNTISSQSLPFSEETRIKIENLAGMIIDKITRDHARPSYKRELESKNCFKVQQTHCYRG